MKKNNILSIGNATTIINSIIVAIAGIIFATFGATLLQFGIDQTLLTQIIGLIIAIIFAYINAKNHNTFWNKDTDEINIPTHMSEEQVAEIKQLIQYYTQEENDEASATADDELIDIDPSLEYEQEENNQ